MPSVLWIDDDSAGFLEIEAALLARGISLVLALNAWTGVERLRTETFDLVIIDGCVELGAPPEDVGFQAAFPADGPPTGLQLVQVIQHMEELRQPGHGFIVCSGLDWQELCKAHPELTVGLPFISKGVLYHQRQVFIDRVAQALNHQTGARPAPALFTPAPLDQSFEGRWHDLRISVLSSLGMLDHAAKRLSQLVRGADSAPDRQVVPIARRFAELAGEAVSDVAYGARNMRDLERLEERVRRLDVAIEDGSAGNVSMAARLAADVWEMLVRFRRTGHTAELSSLHSELQVLSALAEVRLASELLTVAARDTGALNAPDEGPPIDTSALLRQIAYVFTPEALQRRIELRSHEVEPGVMMNHGSAADYRRMLTNVVENAIKYNGQLREAKAWVRLIHGLRERNIVTIVESWGRPIPRAQLAAVFEPRVRGDNAGLSGLGIGLANAQRLAHGLGGRVEIQPGPVRSGRATTSVIFTIPADPPPSA